jgi:hypothetical protein
MFGGILPIHASLTARLTNLLAILRRLLLATLAPPTID